MCLNFSIWVTTGCNLRCVYCYEGEEKKREDLSASQAQKIVDYIKKKAEFTEKTKGTKLERISIELHGGEPLVNFRGVKAFVDTVNDTLAEYNVSYQMTTNATILNDEILTFLKKNIEHLTISIDGDEITQDTCRRDAAGRGTYETVRQNSLKLLEVYGPSLRARMTFTSRTVERLSHNIMHIAAMGFKIIIAQPDLFDKKWDNDRVAILEREVKKLKQHKIADDVYINLEQPMVIQKKGICSAGRDGENIMPNGDIYCCTMAVGNKDYCIGSIDKGIDEGSVDRILSYSAKDIESCSGCAFSAYCDCIRCRIINKLVNDDYCAPIGIQCALNNIIIKSNGYRRIS
jgi:Arylsulfatase regulator (Fe-S oxidoreductase)